MRNKRLRRYQTWMRRPHVLTRARRFALAIYRMYMRGEL